MRSADPVTAGGAVVVERVEVGIVIGHVPIGVGNDGRGYFLTDPSTADAAEGKVEVEVVDHGVMAGGGDVAELPMVARFDDASVSPGRGFDVPFGRSTRCHIAHLL